MAQQMAARAQLEELRQRQLPGRERHRRAQPRHLSLGTGRSPRGAEALRPASGDRRL